MLNSIKLTKIVRQHIKNTTFQKKRDINVTSQNTLSLLSLWPVTAAHLCRPLPMPLAATINLAVARRCPRSLPPVRAIRAVLG